MKYSAHVNNSQGEHQVMLATGENRHALNIPPKANGFGSSASGGELLFLALATCYCNDIYREAAKRGIKVERVEVTVEGEFEAEGEPGRNFRYRARVAAQASRDEILALMQSTDGIAEIHKTLRNGIPVELVDMEAINHSPQ
jgi:organic hydroperoxide reductase OsmC/OhrA